MTNKPQSGDTGVKILAICGIIAVVIIVACVFFPDVIFGLFIKQSIEKCSFYFIKTKKQKNKKIKKFQKSIDNVFFIVYNKVTQIEGN